MRDCTPVIIAARRTAIGTAGRALADLSVDELLAPVLQEIARGSLGPGDDIDQVVAGVARSPGGNPARVAALAAGLDPSVAAITVDLQCGSGLAAICLAADMVRAGSATIVLAGGAESASNAPSGRARFAPSDIGDPDMGPAAEDLARHFRVSRERQDEYALRSHERALASRALLASEIVPVAGLTQDQRPRHLKREVLARMPAAFASDDADPPGTVTAGNSCGISDGAAAVMVVPEWWRAERGLAGLTMRSWATVGVDPRLPGIGPVPAISRILAATSLTLDDLEVIEITEAFAAQVLSVTDALGLDALGVDADRICPLGGAIATGHPWGASGALLMVRLFTQLIPPSSGRRFAAATCAVGGGQGIAALVERTDG